IGPTDDGHQLDLNNGDTDGNFTPSDDNDDEHQCCSAARVDQVDRRFPSHTNKHQRRFTAHVERPDHSASHVEPQDNSVAHVERQDCSAPHVEQQDHSTAHVKDQDDPAPHVEHQDNSATDWRGHQQHIPICRSFNFQNKNIQPLHSLSPQRCTSFSSNQKTAPRSSGDPPPQHNPSPEQSSRNSATYQTQVQAPPSPPISRENSRDPMDSENAVSHCPGHEQVCFFFPF
ncbi:hypothetical protein EV363DRAFT_1150891, partial [Boletus edulis]